MPSTSRSFAALSRIAPLAILFALGGSACGLGAPTVRTASVTLYDAIGRPVGIMQLSDEGAGLSLTGEFHGLEPGEHGIHFHAVGRCDAASGFASAGAHFNPSNRKKHGMENPDGPHAGDLPNLVIDARGVGNYRASTNRVTLGDGDGSLLDADGTALIVHEKRDDQRTDPSGNSGIRLACGIVKPA